MPPTHAEAQDLAEGIYLRSRNVVLRSLDKVMKRLDRVYAKDAKQITKELQLLLKRSGVPPKDIARIVDGVFAASRVERAALVGEAVRAATITATAADERTFKAIFEGDRDAAVPLGGGRSSSPKSQTRSLRLVSASAASSRSTS